MIVFFFYWIVKIKFLYNEIWNNIGRMDLVEKLGNLVMNGLGKKFDIFSGKIYKFKVNMRREI